MSSKKTSTTHQVMTPDNPDWVTQPIQGLLGNINSLAGKDPGQFVAGANPLLTQAGTGAGALTTNPGFGDASSMFKSIGGAPANTATGASLLDNLQSYMNPYTNDVVNTTLKGYDQNSDITRTNQALGIARTKAFGGSGEALTKSLTEGQLATGRAQTEAQLRDQAFNTGAGLSLSDAQLRQQNSEFNAGQKDSALTRGLAAAQGLTGNAAAKTGAENTNIATQGNIGSILQQLDQAKAGAPLNVLQTLAGITGSLPLNLYQGQTTDGTTVTKSSNPLGALASLAGLAAIPFTGGLSAGLLGGLGMGSVPTAAFGAFASDRRLKRDVEKLGERPDGIGVYAFRYLWSKAQHIGVMAQEVLKVKPEAVVTMPNGFYAVDYARL